MGEAENTSPGGSHQADDVQPTYIRHRCGGEVCDVFADLTSYIEDFDDEWQEMMPFVRLN